MLRGMKSFGREKHGGLGAVPIHTHVGRFPVLMELREGRVRVQRSKNTRQVKKGSRNKEGAGSLPQRYLMGHWLSLTKRIPTGLWVSSAAQDALSTLQLRLLVPGEQRLGITEQISRSKSLFLRDLGGRKRSPVEEGAVPGPAALHKHHPPLGRDGTVSPPQFQTNEEQDTDPQALPQPS
ncbi:hypothetical protein Anapl_04904 [Anas platyrhynchos]|uniref:Uncharacterized protein n=1 Tax=Anas platyrhynchos TaxID=8839 RepID=R0K320_ANAPL|nr:hypothetical protein Anapl_04904 [Anas platyrhynchos]